mgnify:CR=1 FL=1
MPADVLPRAAGLARAPRARSRRGRLVVGGVLVAAFALSAMLARWLSPYDPTAVPSALTQGMLRPPSPSHPFGTDALGRDLLSRVLHGGRVSLARGLGV